MHDFLVLSSTSTYSDLLAFLLASTRQESKLPMLQWNQNEESKLREHHKPVNPLYQSREPGRHFQHIQKPASHLHQSSMGGGLPEGNSEELESSSQSNERKATSVGLMRIQYKLSSQVTAGVKPPPPRSKHPPPRPTFRRTVQLLGTFINQNPQSYDTRRRQAAHSSTNHRTSAYEWFGPLSRFPAFFTAE